MLQLVIIASAPRTGSGFLGAALAANGIGNAAEYFNRFGLMPRLRKTHSLSSPASYWEHLKSNCAAGGYLVIKAHVDQFLRLIAGGCPWDDGSVSAPKFLRTARRDRRAQAISLSTAKFEYEWAASGKPGDPFEAMSVLPPETLARRQLVYARVLRLREALWDEYFDSVNASVLDLWYEDYVAAERRTLDEIESFIAHPNPLEFPPDEARSAAKQAAVEAHLRAAEIITPRLAADPAIQLAALDLLQKLIR